MTNFQRVSAWHAACGKTPGNPEHLSVAIGVDLEESTELLTCIRVSSDGWQRVLERVCTDIHDLASAIKSGKIVAHLPNHLRIEVLDAICDREVTGNAVAYLAGFKKDAADEAVLNSNDSKLVDGKAIIAPGGKIMKPDGWSPPELGGFV